MYHYFSRLQTRQQFGTGTGFEKQHVNIHAEIQYVSETNQTRGAEVVHTDVHQTLQPF